jgi:hypothetical protein
VQRVHFHRDGHVTRLPSLALQPQSKHGESGTIFPIVPGAVVTVQEPRFKLIHFDDIEVNTEAAYLVKGLIPRGGMTVVWGPPKCGKTFFVSDLALHIALGWEYRGRRVKQGRVVYLVLEGSRGFKARIAAFKIKYMETYSGPPVPFYVIDVPVKLAADHRHLIDAIKAQLGDDLPALVVIDTLNRALSGSESSDADMGAFVQAADTIRADMNCAVIVVHHCGWETSRMRGFSGLPGALDAELGVTRNEAKEITTEVLRMKDGPEGDILHSKLEPVDLGDDEDGDPITACVIVPIEGSSGQGKSKGLTGDAAKALAALHEILDEKGAIPPTDQYIPPNTKAVAKDQWKEHALKRGFGAARENEATRKAFNRAFDKLHQLNRIGVSGPYVWPIL